MTRTLHQKSSSRVRGANRSTGCPRSSLYSKLPPDSRRGHTIIDFHNHFYPESYIRELKGGGGYARSETDEQGRLLIHYLGDYNVVAGGHVDLEERLRDIDRCGIDMQVLSLTTPGVERDEAQRGIRLARETNDEFGTICEKHRDRFVALAALPLQDPEAAAEELARAVKECGLRGGTVFSNVAGKPLDSKEFMPVYEMAVELDVPLFIHPTSPINHDSMEDYRLVPIMGFGVDTTLAILRLVFSGVMEKLPRLKLVAAHTGGVFQQLRGRIEIAYHMYPECRVNISSPPSTYLKRVWVDTVCYDSDILASARAFSGSEKMLLGSDYPHQIGDLDHAVERVKRMKLGENQEREILGENAAKLLKL